MQDARPLDGRASCASPERKPHLLQRDAAQQPVRRRERVDDLEVVEALAVDQLDRLAVALDRSREIARLPPELVALVLAMGDHDRTREAPDVADRAQR